MQDGEEEVDELGASARVLAEVDEDLLQSVAAEGLGEEEEADEGSEARLVEELDRLAVNGRLLGGDDGDGSVLRWWRVTSGMATVVAFAQIVGFGDEVGGKRLKEVVLLLEENRLAQLRIEAGEESGGVDLGGASRSSGLGSSLSCCLALGGTSSGLLATLLGSFLAKDFGAEVGREGVEELRVDLRRGGVGGNGNGTRRAALAMVLTEDLLAHVVGKGLEEGGVDASIGDVDFFSVDGDGNALLGGLSSSSCWLGGRSSRTAGDGLLGFRLSWSWS